MYRLVSHNRSALIPNLLLALILGFLLGVWTVSWSSSDRQVVKCTNTSVKSLMNPSVDHALSKISLNQDNLGEFYEEYHKFYELSHAW